MKTCYFNQSLLASQHVAYHLKLTGVSCLLRYFHGQGCCKQNHIYQEYQIILSTVCDVFATQLRAQFAKVVRGNLRFFFP